MAHADGAPYTVGGADGPWRVHVITSQDGEYNVFAVSLREIDATSGSLLLIDVAVTGVVLLLIGFAASSVVRIGLRPLTRMQDTAAAIAGGDLSRRVSDADPHTESGSGSVRVWRAEGHAVCEVRDSGRVPDLLAGRLPPDPHSGHGRGLLIINHLCDLVQVRSFESGSAVRLRVQLEAE